MPTHDEGPEQHGKDRHVGDHEDPHAFDAGQPPLWRAYRYELGVGFRTRQRPTQRHSPLDSSTLSLSDAVTGPGRPPLSTDTGRAPGTDSRPLPTAHDARELFSERVESRGRERRPTEGHLPDGAGQETRAVTRGSWP